MKSYSGELAGRTRRALLRLFYSLNFWLDRAADWLALRWDESMLKHYFIRLGGDTLRSLTLMRPRAYVASCLSLCGLMCLGFLVVNQPQPRPSHKVRVDLNRPMVRALSPKEIIGLNPPSAYELAAAYEASSGESGGWFSSGSLSYAEAQNAAPEQAAGLAEPGGAESSGGWTSSRSGLGIENGRIIMRTSLGTRSLKGLGEVELYTDSTPRPARGLKKFAAGIVGSENLLAELSLQNLEAGRVLRVCAATDAATAPNWNKANYGAAMFGAPKRHWSGQYLAGTDAERICRLDRMEQASWLNMLHASHTRGSIYTAKQAGHYRPFVERYATHYALQPSLVYAIMRVESGFNPLAISHANALGLMQVVPETAGNEVHAFLRGKKATPRPELLFTPESNIEYGTTYLHILTTRHFKEVKNPISRELCIIAAYNGGPNAVFRVFNRKRERALEQINKLTPEQLYAKLLTGLSSQETRDYLPRVLAARSEFLRGQAKIQ